MECLTVQMAQMKVTVQVCINFYGYHVFMLEFKIKLIVAS